MWSEYVSKFCPQSYASCLVQPPTWHHSVCRVLPHSMSRLFSLYFLSYLPKPQVQNLVRRTVAVTYSSFRTGSGNGKQDPWYHFYQFQVESTDFSVLKGHLIYSMLNTLKTPKPAHTRPFVSEANFARACFLLWNMAIRILSFIPSFFFHPSLSPWHLNISQCFINLLKLKSCEAGKCCYLCLLLL